MKKTRKLIPALAMLLISAVMMSTASFAWFSMNKQVSATGFEITANSDNVWLAINTGSTFDPTNNEKVATSSGESTALYPVAPATTITAANVETAASWHFAYSNATDNSDKDGDYTACSTIDGYLASETFSIGLSNASGENSAPNLRLTAVSLPEDTGISVVVVCGTNAYTHTDSADSLNETLAANVTKAGTVITVYYFINGEDDNVFVDNIANLKGKVTLSFDVGTVVTP